MQDVLEIDEFAGQRTGDNCESFGPQASISYYLGKLPLGDVAILHRDFSPQGHFMTWSLKALSKILCLSTIAQTTHFVILVRKSLAVTAFGMGFRGRVLANIGIHSSVGSTDPVAIAQSVY